MRLAVIAVFLTACSEFGFGSTDAEDPPQQLVGLQDVFVQAPLPSVDLLFVVDDTSSMDQEQQALAEDFSALITELTDAGVGWQVGVATTDMTSDDAGWLRGSPWILTPTMSDVDAQFAEMVQVGTAGAGPEAGLAAAATVLSLATADGPNAGFRRPGATLHVVFVSDADDQSDDWLDDPVADFQAILDEEALATGMDALASAVIGDVPSGCASDNGTAQPGFRYQEVVDATGGVSVSICEADFGELLSNLGTAAIAYQTRFPLRESPLPDSVAVHVDGQRVDDGFVIDFDDPAVVFDTAPAPNAVIEVAYLVTNQ